MSKIFLALLLAISVLPARAQQKSVAPPPENHETGQVAHVRGIVRQGIGGDPGAPVPMFPVTFQSGAKTFTAESNIMGEYEIDLPTGLYTMMISTGPQQHTKQIYRPLFLADGSSNLTFDIAVPQIGIDCDPAEPINRAVPASEFSCMPASDEIQLPSKEGLPFEILVKYQSKNLIDAAGSGSRISYNAVDAPRPLPVFPLEIYYNLFALSADKAIYDQSSHVIEASGHVVATWADGPIKRGDAMKFKLENSQAKLLP